MVFFIVMALLLIGAGISSYVGAVSFRNDINEAVGKNERNIAVMTASEYGEGMNVYGEVQYLLGCYCEKSSTDGNSSKVTGSYYIMPVAADNGTGTAYITITLYARDQQNIGIFENITNDTYEMLEGKEDIERDYYCLYGKVKPLDSAARPYMEEFIREADLLDSYDKETIGRYVLPYQLEIYDYETRLSDGVGMTIFGLVIIGIIGIILTFIHIGRTREQKAYYDRVMPMAEYDEGQAENYAEKRVQGTDGKDC